MNIFWLFIKWTNAADTKTSTSQMLAHKDSFISVKINMNTNNQYSVISAREIWREKSIKIHVAREEGNIFWGTDDLWSRGTVWKTWGHSLSCNDLSRQLRQRLISLLHHSNELGFILEETQWKGIIQGFQTIRWYSEVPL